MLSSPVLRLRLLLLLGLLGLLPSTALAETPAETATGLEATIEADTIEADLSAEETSASGQAHLSYENFQLLADHFTANQVTGEVTATGHLELVQGTRRLYGASLRYNLYTATGSIEHARAAEQGVYVTGQEITLSPSEIVAKDAFFTTCSAEPPHFGFAARQLTLTAAQPVPGQPPRSGRLSLTGGRVVYRGRTLFPVPGYSVRVGEIGTKKATPTPVFGFSGDDGPYLNLGYGAHPETAPVAGEFSYRYTTYRGIRGFARLYRPEGPGELTFGYYRRQDPGDRDIEPNDLQASLADVLVDRKPEYGAVMPTYYVAPKISLQASWLAGHYVEYKTDGIVELAEADRTSLTALLAYTPYPISPSVSIGPAVGWRSSRYSTGESFTIRLLATTLYITPSPRVRLQLSYTTRDTSGETPFLFDGVGSKREAIADVRWTLNPAWRLRLVEDYDLERHQTRDMIVEATRTAHCLEYTIGWRRDRGALFFGFGLAPPAVQEQE